MTAGSVDFEMALMKDPSAPEGAPSNRYPCAAMEEGGGPYHFFTSDVVEPPCAESV